MTTGLPSKITITETHERELDISSLRYAVVSRYNDITFALFKWKDRAEDYKKKYAYEAVIIDLKPCSPVRMK
jgi:hypothetical protein